MKKVILIDDSALQLSILKLAFEKNGWEVYSAQNAKIAYEMIFDCAPDLIVTDAIMPIIGGFQLVKLIRQHESISKIPVIIYSVLAENNAKYYMQEEYSEYFLKKDDNTQELINLAEKIIQKYPIDEMYKKEILKQSLSQAYNPPIDIEKNDIFEIEKIEEELIDRENLISKFKNIANSSDNEEKSLKEILSSLFSILKYDLFILSMHSSEKKQNVVYFDIKNIILSPIFQNNILKKFNTKEGILYKKYAPNSKTIIKEEEFLSKVEFNLKHEEKTLINVIYYCQEKDKWQNIDNIETIKIALENFFKTKNINTKTKINKSEKNKYYSNNSNFNIEFNPSNSIYLGILDIYNYTDFKQILSQEEMDILNSKLSEKIMKFSEKNDKATRVDDDEYNILIEAKDIKQASYKFNYILNSLNDFNFQGNFIDARIGIVKCNFENNFNLSDFQEIAKEYMYSTNENNKMVIKDE